MDNQAATTPSPIQLITSSSRVSDRLTPTNPIKSPSRYQEIVAGIAHTSKILILSGDAALNGTGIEPLDCLVPAIHQLPRITYWSLIDEAMKEPHKYSVGSLAKFNRVMTARRIAARQARKNLFLDYLEALCKEDKLTKCLTTSIDGLEAWSSPDVAPSVFPIYGDNRYTRCLHPDCKGLQEDETSALDNEFLTQDMTTCEECQARNVKANKSRRFGTKETRALRPAVRKQCRLSFVQIDLPIEDDGDPGDEYIDEPNQAVVGKGKDVPEKKDNATSTGAIMPKKLRKKPRERRQFAIRFTHPDPTVLQGYDGGCHLFLILGAPPKDVDLLEATRELASSVRGRGGAVVYIDPAPLHGTSQHDHIDIHLQADIQEALGEIMQQMRRRSGPTQPMEDLRSDADLWFELVKNDVPVRQTERAAYYGRDTCAHCYCGIPEYLARCTQCIYSYCYRRVQDDGSEDGDSDVGDLERYPLNNAETSLHSGPGLQPLVSPPNQGSGREEPESFRFHEACLAFNMFATGDSRPSLTEAMESFVCPDCWDYQDRGLYPHFVRAPQRESVELSGGEWPRLFMVVYYVEEFWPQTTHLITLTTGFWRQLGWEYRVQPVKLQQLKERDDPSANLKWEPGTYQFIAVYLTHGLTGSQGYQLNNTDALRPVELLTQSLAVVQTALAGASDKFLFLFACGHPMYHPDMVAELREWVNM